MTKTTYPRGTVGYVIAQLEAIKDKNLALYFDCPKCGQANIFTTVRNVAVIETERRKD
jgi:hypothetical protein